MKASLPRLQPRLVVFGVEGWGKTSLIAHAPEAGIIMARGETGYLTLLSQGAPDIPATVCERWTELLALLDGFIAMEVEERPFKVLGLDTIGCFEKLLRQHLVDTRFGGKFDETGFLNYGRGYEYAAAEWETMLARLDQLWEQGVMVVLLGHVTIKAFRNPTGPDFDRFVSDVHAKLWEPTKRWADAVLFGRYQPVVREAKGSSKAKGMGGQTRILLAEYNDAYDAKNRFDMDEKTVMPNQPHKMWEALCGALKKGRKE